MRIDGLALGKYRIEKLISNGSFASVFRAREELTNRVVAIKMLPKSIYPTGRMRYLLTELSAMGLNWGHPNIVSIHTVEPGDEEYVAYIVMEYVDGPALRQFLSVKRPSPALAINIAMDICRGLIAAHEHNIIHRDIKPQNVLLTSDHVAKISDFGVARILETTNDYAGTITGTRKYMAPEQYEGNYDYRADLYSAGLILCEMIMGRFPFRGKNHDEIQMKKRHMEIQFDDDHPQDVCELVGKALHRDLEARYQTAEEMYNDLATIREARYVATAKETLTKYSDPATREATLSEHRKTLQLSMDVAEKIELAIQHGQKEEAERQKQRQREIEVNTHYNQAIQYVQQTLPEQALQEIQQAHRLFLNDVPSTKKADWIFRSLRNWLVDPAMPSTADGLIELMNRLPVDEMLKLKAWFYEQFPPSESPNESSPAPATDVNCTDGDASSSFKHQSLNPQEPAPELVLQKLHEVIQNPHEIIAAQICETATKYTQQGKSRRSRTEYKKLGEFYKKTALDLVDFEDWVLIADCYARARLGYTAARRYGSARQSSREAGMYYARSADLFERQQDWAEAGRLYTISAEHYALADIRDEADESWSRSTICHFNIAENARATGNLNLAYDYCVKILETAKEMRGTSNAVTGARKLIQEIEMLFTVHQKK